MHSICLLTSMELILISANCIFILRCDQFEKFRLENKVTAINIIAIKTHK